ncbi:hypothetical protein PG993_000214 [Apiospora rasikravindrae]|uniref:Uncharacterized protein n=1 Tax=Apiospora rasikravindrae TaxID=990691 RepID=A0ABR1U7W4_9PEZI
MTTDPGSAPTKTTSRGAGPLTTVFHTPEFCATDRWTDIGTPALSSSICMPPNFMQYFGNKAGMYSPAICPDGYTDGCTFPTALPSVEDGTPLYGGPLLAGETARLCCPTGYTCYTGPQTAPEMPYSRCISAARSSRTYVESHVTHTTRNMVYAIQVRWQESDLSILETDPTVPGSTFTEPTATTTPDPGDGDGGPAHMPFHLILAIAIAVLLFLILLGIVAWLVWRRHFWKQQVIHRELASTPDLRKGGEAHFDHSAAGLANQDEPTPLLARPTPAFSRPTTSSYVVSPLTPAASEMDADMLPSIHEAPADARPRMELEAREEAQELPAMSFGPVELEGSTPGDMIQPQPPRSPLQQQQQQQEGAYTTSKSGGEAVGDEKSPNGGADGGMTRRRKSLGVNRTTQANPPPPYSDES